MQLEVNKQYPSKNLVKYIIAFLSGVWLYFISPPSILASTAWFAYIPLLILISSSNKKESALFGFIYGFVGNFLIFSWLIKTVSTFSSISVLLSVLIVALDAFILALPLALFALLANIAWNRLGHWWVLVVPSLLVLIEYLSVYISLFPYQHGMSQFEILSVLQLASITGIWGVTFIILLVNTFIVSLIKSRTESIKAPPISAGITISICIALVFSYGFYKVDDIEKITESHPKLSLLQLQDEVPVDEWVSKMKNPAIGHKLFRYWVEQTEKFNEPVDWIIWPESSTSFDVEKLSNRKKFSELVKSKNSYLSLGGVARELSEDGQPISFNSVFNFSPSGDYLGRYDKQHLVPFSEYTPLAKTLGFKEIMSSFTPGKHANTFKIKGAEVAFPICYEAIFQSAYRQFENADLIANVSNDIWFVNSEGRELHAMISQIRAIEFGVPIIRTGYTGLSFYIKPNGRRLFDLPPDSKQSRKIEIEYGKIATIYSQWGDWFVILCLLIVLAFTLFSDKFKSIKKTA